MSYLNPDSELTLGEGIDQYYSQNPHLLPPESMAGEIRELFKQHDAGHVVFGCDTSIRGESLIDTWTVFGTTAGLRGYIKYFEHQEVNNVFAETGYWTITLESCKCLPDIFRAMWRGIRMKKKWPWQNFEDYLDQRLVDLRVTFDIRVL